MLAWQHYLAVLLLVAFERTMRLVQLLINGVHVAVLLAFACPRWGSVSGSMGALEKKAGQAAQIGLFMRSWA